MQEHKQPLQRNAGQWWRSCLGMHLEIDRKAPLQTYKEMTRLEAASAVLSCVILFYTANRDLPLY